jgi:ribosome-binding protein aMBF1 (putative translation factor)
MSKKKVDTSFDHFLKKQLEDPDVRAEYEALEPEFALIQALIDARAQAGLTQQQLSARTGIAQSDISKFENGNGNPSLKTLRRLAAGMGMRLSIQFEPVTNQ